MAMLIGQLSRRKSFRYITYNLKAQQTASEFRSDITDYGDFSRKSHRDARVTLCKKSAIFSENQYVLKITCLRVGFR